MQARARVHALQARIRPHFLFNSMNTIASLTRSDPALAESAVQDLADLFRANLSEKRNTITLAEEIEVARIYQRIEQLRLGRAVARRVEHRRSCRCRPSSPACCCSPCWRTRSITGSSRSRKAARSSVKGEVSGGSSPWWFATAVGDRQSDREGNKLALANIRERLSLMYGERALVKAGRFDEEYIVTLRFPHVEKREALPA